MKTIGFVNSLDFGGFVKYITEYIDNSKKDDWGNIIDDPNFLEKAASTLGISSHGSTDKSASRYLNGYSKAKIYNKNTTELDRKLNFLKKQIDYSAEYGQLIPVAGLNDEFVYIDFGYIKGLMAYYAIPTNLCSVRLLEDYSDIQADAISENPISNSLPSLGGKTENSLKNEISAKEDEIQNKEDEIKAKEQELRDEIARMKHEIELKYKSAFDLLSKKKEELDIQKKQLESELFVLDAKIYGIRCHNGEVIKFTQLVSGEHEDNEAPLVIYQKIRFLDEELSKYVALYSIDGSTHSQSTFEELVKAREDIRDLFFPSGKSASLLRITRDNHRQSSGQTVFSDGSNIFMQNVIEEYEVFHGSKIAILLRDGDNCFIGWTDDDRFRIDDGNAFLTPDTNTEMYEGDASSSSGTDYSIRTSKEVVASRYFLFSALQGAMDNNIINVPDGVSIIEKSPYIVFSMADNWLTDKGYGTLSEILEKYSGKLQVGDDILTTQSLRAERDTYSNNDRGIGYNNRTHDVLCKDNTIYPINLIEKEDLYKATYTYNERQYTSYSSSYKQFTSADEFAQFVDEGVSNISVEPYEKRDVYISLKKEGWYYTYSESRANFHLYSDEFIPLTFLNSDFIKNILVTRRLGDTFRSYNFSTSIKYLNRMIEYLVAREEVEEELIVKELDNKELPSDWRVKLSDWKLEHNIHKITEFQAKRFAKTL